jgi:hypothetical protein
VAGSYGEVDGDAVSGVKPIASRSTLNGKDQRMAGRWRICLFALEVLV